MTIEHEIRTRRIRDAKRTGQRLLGIALSLETLYLFYLVLRHENVLWMSMTSGVVGWFALTNFIDPSNRILLWLLGFLAFSCVLAFIHFN
ncbi:MAG: hypothetical protein AAB845_02450 [Patescibacteria group bacterium]